MLIHKVCKSIPLVSKASITVLTNFVITTGIKAVGDSRVKAIETEREEINFYCPTCNTEFSRDQIEIECDNCHEFHSSNPSDFKHLRSCYLTVCNSCQRTYFPDEQYFNLETVLNKVA